MGSPIIACNASGDRLATVSVGPVENIFYHTLGQFLFATFLVSFHGIFPKARTCSGLAKW